MTKVLAKVEIDCDGEKCGRCGYHKQWVTGEGPFQPGCDLFHLPLYEPAGGSRRRLPDCIAAEANAILVDIK